jgi:hypothetical protein
MTQPACECYYDEKTDTDWTCPSCFESTVKGKLDAEKDSNQQKAKIAQLLEIMEGLEKEKFVSNTAYKLSCRGKDRLLAKYIELQNVAQCAAEALEEANETECSCSFSTDAERGFPKEYCSMHNKIDQVLQDLESVGVKPGQ